MKSNSPLAVWSMILGILAVIPCCGLGPLTGIPAIICGHMARSKVKSEPDKWTGDGMAIAGLIMGYFSIVLFLLFIFLVTILAIFLPAALKNIPNMPNLPMGIMF